MECFEAAAVGPSTSVSSGADLVEVTCGRIAEDLGEPTQEGLLAACEAAAEAVWGRLAAAESLELSIDRSDCLAAVDEPLCGDAPKGGPDCKLACLRRVVLDTPCTPPPVLATSADAPLAATLEANLPTILEWHIRAEPLFDLALWEGGQPIAVAEALMDEPACVSEHGSVVVAAFSAEGEMSDLASELYQSTRAVLGSLWPVLE